MRCHVTPPARLRRLPAFACAATCLWAATAAPPSAAAGGEGSEGTALVARAERLENLLAADAAHFRLRVHVKLLGLVVGTREGDVELLSAGPERWVEHVRFPGYSEDTGVVGGERWRKRNVIDKPYRFHEVTQLLDLWAHLRLAPRATIKDVTQRSVAGQQARCITVGPTTANWQRDIAGRAATPVVGPWEDSRAELCFAADSGALLSAMYGEELPRFEYEGLVALGAKAYPKTMRCFEGKQLAVEATVEELAAVPEADDPGSFAAPSGAERWPMCDAPTPPTLVVKRDAGVDQYAKARRLYGTVIALAEVGTDGLIHNLAFVQGRGVLHDNVQKASQAWKYAPATCNGVPVPSEIYIAYRFLP